MSEIGINIVTNSIMMCWQLVTLGC